MLKSECSEHGTGYWLRYVVLSCNDVNVEAGVSQCLNHSGRCVPRTGVEKHWCKASVKSQPLQNLHFLEKNKADSVDFRYDTCI